jgi:hypothetical protein
MGEVWLLCRFQPQITTLLEVLGGITKNKREFAAFLLYQEYPEDNDMW